MKTKRKTKLSTRIYRLLNWEYVLPLLGKYFIILCILAFIFKGALLIYDSVSYAMELEKNKEYSYAMQLQYEEELQKEYAEINMYELSKKEKQKEEHNKKIEDMHKKFKIGDSIKILDQNAVVPYKGSYRLSVGAIDTIENFEDDFIIGAKGKYPYGSNIEKITSKREKRELIQQELEGKIYFEEDK